MAIEFSKCCQTVLDESPSHVVRWFLVIALRSFEVAGLNRDAWRNWMIWAGNDEWSYTRQACLLNGSIEWGRQFKRYCPKTIRASAAQENGLTIFADDHVAGREQCLASVVTQLADRDE